MRDFILLFAASFISPTSQGGHQETYLILAAGPSVQNPTDTSSAQNQDPIAEFQKDIQFLPDIDNRDPTLLLLVQEAVDRVGGIDVKSAHRVSRQENSRLRGNLPTQQNLLYISTR
jgi:hypothetical protein